LTFREPFGEKQGSGNLTGGPTKPIRVSGHVSDRPRPRGDGPKL